MKRILSIFTIFALLLTCTACSPNQKSSENEPEDTPQKTEDTVEVTSDKALVIYFSWSGNTEAVAKEIQLQTKADIFEIVPKESYTEDYDTLLDIAQEEQSSDARPEIANEIENFDSYDTIYLGYPNWWGDMPMILYTLLDTYNFSNKTIAPFVTSGGSGLSSTVDTIKDMEPNANVLEGLSVSSDDAKDSSEMVTSWLASLN